MVFFQLFYCTPHRHIVLVIFNQRWKKDSTRCFDRVSDVCSGYCFFTLIFSLRRTDSFILRVTFIQWSVQMALNQCLVKNFMSGKIWIIAAIEISFRQSIWIDFICFRLCLPNGVPINIWYWFISSISSRCLASPMTLCKCLSKNPAHKSFVSALLHVGQHIWC